MLMNKTLVQTLPSGPLDIIGDIHGEYEALCALLGELDYAVDGTHPEGRRLVFVGDFCDRGPNSPAVIKMARDMIQAGRAYAVLGNHEINLLRDDPKAGSGWYFDQREESDQRDYEPFVRATADEKGPIKDFFLSLPLVLERDDIRIVHAAWLDECVDAVRSIPTTELLTAFDRWEEQALAQVAEEKLVETKAQEQIDWPYSLEDETHQPPLLKAHARLDVIEQNQNPIKILTSGIERETSTPFYTSGKWRFAERIPWWNDYDSPMPVVFGHYWRRVHEIDRSKVGKNDPDLFAGISPFAWHGKHRTALCIDYSVGGRWRARKDGEPLTKNFKLAALRWPEQSLVFDDGKRIKLEVGE